MSEIPWEYTKQCWICGNPDVLCWGGRMGLPPVLVCKRCFHFTNGPLPGIPNIGLAQKGQCECCGMIKAEGAEMRQWLIESAERIKRGDTKGQREAAKEVNASSRPT